jgi:PAS domain S-box-containing protein
MKLNFLNWRSIRTRVLLLTVAILFVSILLPSPYISGALRDDLLRLVSAQQLSTVSLVADEINRELQDRLAELQFAADKISPTKVNNASTLQQFLDLRPDLLAHFNGGVLIFRADGVVMAEAPGASYQPGGNFADTQSLQAALQQGRSSIGLPLLGKLQAIAMFAMTAPVYDSEHRIIGAIAGLTRLTALGTPSRSSYLDGLIESVHGESGDFMVVAASQRQIVTATQKSRIMERLNTAGSLSLLAQASSNEGATSIYLNEKGQEVLASAKRIPLADWVLVAALPSKEALAPVINLQWRGLLADLLGFLLVAALMAWMLKRQLAPVLAAAGALRSGSNQAHNMRPLPILRQDEIGDLIGAFNAVLQALAQQREALRESEERLRGLYELSPLGITLVDGHGRFIEFNEAFRNITGFTDLELKALNFWQVTPEQYALDHQAQLHNLEHNGRFGPYEKECRRKDNSLVPVSVNGMRVTGRDGQQYIWSIIEDISERKCAETALQQSELLLRTAIETLGEAFAIFDADDRLVFFNQQYLDYYPMEAPLIAKGNTFEEIIRYGLARGQYPQAIGQEAQWLTERLACHRLGQQVQIQKLSGERWVKVSERRTQDGHFVGFRVDVTELYQAREAAQAASVTKSMFLATMSHEIRTPLNAILGLAQLLMKPKLSAAERLNFSKTILSSGQTLLTLLNDILDLSKIEAGKVELESIEMEPAEIIHETRALFAEIARAKGLQLESCVSVSSGAYLGDPNRLRLMLSNLVSNAIKFTQTGFVRMEAHEVEDPGSTALLEFSVSDSGPGISPEKQARLFQAFSQTDSSTAREYGGTGLGLFNVRCLAELMGGMVGVSSEVGVGTRFWFRIRAARLGPGTGGQAHLETDATITAELLDKRADRARALQLVAEIEPLIKHNKFNAISHFSLLQELMAGTLVAAELVQIGRLLEEFRFRQALVRLHRMVASQRWQEATHD